MAINQRLLSCAHKLRMNTAAISYWYHKYSGLKNFFYGDLHRFVGISIETSTYCHRKCPYCPNSKYEIPKNYMQGKTYELVISRLREINFSGVLNFSFYNEPLLDGRLSELVKYAKEKIPRCLKFVATCGDFLGLEKAAELIGAGVDKFMVTVHEPGGSALMEKLKPVILRYPQNISIITLKDGQLLNRGGLVETNAKRLTKKEIKKRCGYYLKYMVIDYQGNILICCNDYFKKYKFGNLTENSIDKIWYSGEFAGIRKDIANGVIKLDICKKCLGIE